MFKKIIFAAEIKKIKKSNMKKIVSLITFVSLSVLFFSFISITTNPETEFEYSGDDTIKVGNEIGNNAGDFEAEGVDGEILKLSDLRGKLVLFVLWNSKCHHCNVENMLHKEAWEKYHDKEFVNGDGFDVYCIALDKERATWIEALEKYKFPWHSNVYVLDSWKSAEIRFFGIKNLPGIFLIDGNGIILAKKFPGKDLPEMLEKYLKK